MIGVTTAPAVIAAEEAKKSAVEAQILRSGVQQNETVAKGFFGVWDCMAEVSEQMFCGNAAVQRIQRIVKDKESCWCEDGKRLAI